MKEELKKSLTDLIDETLLELDELKKSRFSAAEIEIKGPGADELAGKPVNGKLAEKAEDKKDEDKDAEDDKAEKAEKAEKCEKCGKSPCECKKDDDKKDESKAEDKKEDPKADAKDEKPAFADMKKEEDVKELKKSVDAMESLMKSYVDEKIAPLQTQLSSILDAVNKLANSPAPAKGVSYKGVAPLMKSENAEPLSKSEVASKLFELKKSGTRVDSADIARAEMGHDLEKIVGKYNIQ